VRAVHAGPPRRVDVEPAVHDQVVSGAGRHPGRQGGVVVDLQLVAIEVSDEQVLVVSDRRRVCGQPAMEGDLGAGATRGELRLQRGVVSAGAVAAGGGED
jgi:hypothetical protein